MPLVDAKALARTYDPSSRLDPWDGVELYRESQTYPENWGSQRVASAINSDQSNDFEGISRSQVRAWVDGDSMPDAARAVNVAQELGWTDEPWTETTRALAKLVIGVYAFGSVSERNYVPSWSPDDPESEAVIEDALDSVGVGYQHVERENPSQGDEIKPAKHGTKLGRALHVAGGPVGDKNVDSVRALPEWVVDAPIVLKLELALLFVRGRGVQHDGRATRTIQTDRGPQYFRDVARLIEDVTGATANASDNGVTISADAVRELGLA